MKTLLIAAFVCLLPVMASAQEKIIHRLDLAAAIGESQGTISGSAWHHWRMGKKKRLELGIGARLSAYFGNKKDFITAPADIARGSSVPFLVVISSQETQNWDTLTVQQPRVAAVNAAISLTYHFTPRWSAGANIDLVGFTIGNKSTSIFTANGQQQTVDASAAAFNLLLTGDLDKGSLNSEFYVNWKFRERWSARAIYQFFFVEYKTERAVQQIPKSNDRFRNKANMLGIGVSYYLN